MKRFSDFATEITAMTGDKIKIEEILGKEIEVIGYKISDSQYKKNGNDRVLTLQFRLNGAERVVFTGSSVLMDQIERYKDELPFLTTVARVNKFYTFARFAQQNKMQIL